MNQLIDMKSIQNKVNSNQRINSQEAKWLYLNAGDNDLKNLSQVVRGRFHNANEATWTMMCIINFTNICVAKCDFCAFYRLPHQDGTYTLNPEQLIKKVTSF